MKGGRGGERMKGGRGGGKDERRERRRKGLKEGEI